MNLYTPAGGMLTLTNVSEMFGKIKTTCAKKRARETGRNGRKTGGRTPRCHTLLYMEGVSRQNLPKVNKK